MLQRWRHAADADRAARSDAILQCDVDRVRCRRLRQPLDDRPLTQGPLQPRPGKAGSLNYHLSTLNLIRPLSTAVRRAKENLCPPKPWRRRIISSPLNPAVAGSSHRRATAEVSTYEGAVLRSRHGMRTYARSDSRDGHRAASARASASLAGRSRRGVQVRATTTRFAQRWFINYEPSTIN